MNGIDLKNTKVNIKELTDEFVRRLSGTAEKKIRETLEQIGLEFKPEEFQLRLIKAEFNKFELTVTSERLLNENEDEKNILQWINTAQGEVVFQCTYDGNTANLIIASRQGIAPINWAHWQITNLTEVINNLIFDTQSNSLKCCRCKKDIAGRYIEIRPYSGRWKLIPSDGSRHLQVRCIRAYPYKNGDTFIEVDSYLTEKAVSDYPSALVICPKCQQEIKPEIKSTKSFEKLMNFGISAFSDAPSRIQSFGEIKKEPILDIRLEEA